MIFPLNRYYPLLIGDFPLPHLTTEWFIVIYQDVTDFIGWSLQTLMRNGFKMGFQQPPICILGTAPTRSGRHNGQHRGTTFVQRIQRMSPSFSCKWTPFASRPTLWLRFHHFPSFSIMLLLTPLKKSGIERWAVKNAWQMFMQFHASWVKH